MTAEERVLNVSPPFGYATSTGLATVVKHEALSALFLIRAPG